MLGFQGAKGGSGGSFKQRPDTLRSTDTFEGLLGLCAGPIKGLTRGLKSLKIDGTPLEDESGRLNFENFVAIFADGNPASFPQQVDLRLGAGGSPVAVNLALSNTAPSGPGPWITKSVANLNADFLDLRFLVNQLYRQDKKGIYEHTANIEIQLKPTGAVNWISPMLGTPSQTWSESGTTGSSSSVLRLLVPKVFYDMDAGGVYRPETNNGYFRIYGKTSSVAVHELRIAVPNDGAYADRGWDVRCRLIEKESVDADPNFEKRNITWESVTAGYNTKLGVTEPWRGLSWLQLYGKASDQLTGVPSVTGEYDTLIVPVPPSGVFNPDSRTYTGAIWDGSWAQSFTTDPAWNINGLLMNSLFGLASVSPGARLNKWDALEASKWFSAPVPDGNGGFEPRSSLNIALNEPQKASEFVPYLAGAVGALAWEEGNGEWRLKVDKPEAATDIFTLETISGEFAYSHTNVDTRFNDITYVFRNKEFDYREDRVRVVDSEHIERFGRKPTTIVGIGCTGRQEAIRRAIMRLRVSTRETRAVRFVTNRRGRLVQPLSAILVADGDLGFLTELDENTRSTGRIIGVASDRLSFDVRDPLHLELGVAYSVTFTVPNPDYAPDADVDREGVNTTSPTVTQTIALTNSAAQRGNVTTIYLAEALPEDVAPNANIALSADGLPTLPKPYRVTSVEPNGESIVISAIEIDSGKWDASDSGEAEMGYVPPLDAVVPAVENATITLSQFPSENQLVTVLSVGWDRPASNMLAGYRIEQRLNGGEWQVINARTNLNAIERVNPQFGVWEFRITSIDRRERTSEPVIVSTEVNEAVLAEAGPYDDAKTYYYGQIVSIADGSRWRYNNAIATAGNDPEEGSDYWVRLSDAATGPSGSSVAMVFQRSATQPATPTPGMTSPPAGGWYDDIASVPVDDEPLWASIGFRSDETSFWLWNVAIKVEGQDGAPGAPGADGQPRYIWYAYADAPDGTFNFATGAPGNRFYQGIAVNKTTAVEGADPADYVWAPYGGPPNFGLASFNSNTVLAGNKLIKVAGGASWNGSVHSTESFKGGATVSFVVDTATQFMVGLNTDPTTDASYASIDFAIYITATDVVVYESGSAIVAAGVAPVPGDVFTITYNNKAVVYSKNGVPFYTNSAPAANLALFLDSSLVYPGVQVGRILSFAAAGSAGADGVDTWTPFLVGGTYARAGGNFTGVFEIRSTESVTQARASGRLTATDDSTGIGLYDPSTGDLYELITYSLWGTDARLHHYSVSHAPTGVNAAAGQTWEVAHIGDQIRAFIDGVDVGQIGPDVPADRALMASFRTTGASKTIENCVFARSGAPGTSPPLIFVASTHQTFRYDTAGSPLSQTTTITATRQNTAGTTEWQLSKADGTIMTAWTTAALMVSAGGASSSPNNDTLVIDQTQFTALLAFASTTGLIYEARMSGATSVQDRISIVKVQDGAEGGSGANGLSIAATKPILAVARTAAGGPKSGELPKTTQMIVYDGFTDITSSCTYSRTAYNCSASNDGGGAFTLTAVTDLDAYFDVTAEAPDGREITMRIVTSQPKDGSAASRATANVTSMNASGTYTAIATVDIVAAAGATISGNASTTYLAASFVGTGTRTVRQQAKVSIQNLTDGGAEVDGAAQIGSAASYIGGDGPSDVGQVSASNYVTNSSGAPKTFRLKFYIRYYDGATTAQTAGGTFSGNIEAQVA